MYQLTRYSGTHQEIGVAIGHSLKTKLLANIQQMMHAVSVSQGINRDKLARESMWWLERLPDQYQTELSGIAQGANCSLQQIAEWYYCSMCPEKGCTSFIIRQDEQLWVARNNDYLLPRMWGNIGLLHVTGQIPVMLFGLEGDIFTGTGYNQEKLWIHYNWLPVAKTPLSQQTIPPFVFIRQALETCRSIEDVKCLLDSTARDGGMNLFVVDGKSNEYKVFECDCQTIKTRDSDNRFIVGANHFTQEPHLTPSASSLARQARMEYLLNQTGNYVSVEEMISILADPEVEQHELSSGTVYANIACPATDTIFFAHSGFPAASRSDWERVNWCWK